MSIKVIYIMGHGRSGSTLLDLMLASDPSVFGAGELCNLITAMDVRHNRCSCGQESAKCPLWSEAREEWETALSGGTAAAYASLQDRVIRIRHIRRNLGYRPGSDPLIDRYVTQTHALLRAIANASRCNTIVDSSKHPVRALALSRMPGVDLRVIHLVRDVRGVACSLMRSWEPDPDNGIVNAIRGKKPMRTAASWLLTNAVANLVRSRLRGRSILVRYEDLVAEPSITLRRISTFTGINFSSVASQLVRGEAFHADHAIEGNRLRMQQHVRLHPDTRWQRDLSAPQKCVLPLVAAPVAWQYGYRPW